MNNLRRLKGKRRSKIMNPEQMAQQRLFEISRFADQEQLHEPDTFLQNLQSKNFCKSRSPKHVYTQPSTTKVSPEFKKTRVSNMFSFNQFKQKSSLILLKKPLSITNYILIDERIKKSSKELSDKSGVFDYVSFIRRRTADRGVQRNNSQDFKRQIKRQRPKSFKTETNPAIQIKNIRLFSKYPTVFPH